MGVQEMCLLTVRLEQQLADTCQSRLPQETCGILCGRYDGQGITEVDRFAVVRNSAGTTARSFAFDAGDWVRTYYETQKNQRSIVGFFHSHPGGAPLPSTADTAGWLPWGTYWIVGFSAGGWRIAAYRRGSAGGWHTLPVYRELPARS